MLMQTIAKPSNINAQNFPTWLQGDLFAATRSGDTPTVPSLTALGVLSGLFVGYDPNKPKEAFIHGVTDWEKFPKLTRISGLQTPLTPSGLPPFLENVRKPVPIPSGEVVLSNVGVRYMAQITLVGGMPEGGGIIPPEYGPHVQRQHHLIPLQGVGGKGVNPEDLIRYPALLERGEGKYAIAGTPEGEITIGEKHFASARLVESRVGTYRDKPALEAIVAARTLSAGNV